MEGGKYKGAKGEEMKQEKKKTSKRKDRSRDFPFEPMPPTMVPKDINNTVEFVRKGEESIKEPEEEK